MRKINLVPNAITAFGLACGLFMIFKVSMDDPATGLYQMVHASIVLLLLAALADLLDGAVARIMHAESEFGFMFDSLADAVSFGVAPSVLLLKSLFLSPGSGFSLFAVIGCLLFSLCGILRLVRFNVKATEARGNPILLAAQKKHFTGLPIPAGALTAVSTNLLLVSPFADLLGPISEESRVVIMSCVMVILGFFMISNWKFPSLKVLHFRVPSFYLVFVTAILALSILYGIFHFFPLVLFTICWGYVGLGWILSGIRLIAGKKSKTLEDFEPEDDE